MQNIRNQYVMLLLLPVFLTLCSGIAMASIGVVTEVSGLVELERASESFALTEGVNINAGDIVSTDNDASVQIDMDDGSMLSLGENSQIHIRDYVLREDKSVLSASVDLAVGWLRFAVAHLRSAGRYQIQMPTAVLGVRGTEGLLQVEPEDGYFSSHVVMDEGRVELAERQEKGRLLGTRIFLNAGEYAERQHDGRLLKSHQAPAWLVAAISKRMKKRLIRRSMLLKKRGVLPRKLRHSIRKNLIKRAIERKKRRVKAFKAMQSRQKFRKKLEKQRR